MMKPVERLASIETLLNYDPKTIVEYVVRNVPEPQLVHIDADPSVRTHVPSTTLSEMPRKMSLFL